MKCARAKFQILAVRSDYSKVIVTFAFLRVTLPSFSITQKRSSPVCIPRCSRIALGTVTESNHFCNLYGPIFFTSYPSCIDSINIIIDICGIYTLLCMLSHSICQWVKSTLQAPERFEQPLTN